MTILLKKLIISLPMRCGVCDFFGAFKTKKIARSMQVCKLCMMYEFGINGK